MLNKLNKALSLTAILSMLAMPTSALALSKDETVYTKINSNGTNTIVSEHLINDKKEDTITEKTDLTDIYNSNGNEDFTLDNNTLTWTSNGKDIYYQGKTTNELPIDMNITYKLDGEEISATDLVGKSGSVTITIKYTNKDVHYVNGEKLYTPFVIALGTSIPTKNNSNVKVTNGKVTSTGTSNIIAAISTPGLYESLNIDALKSLDTVTITYDTTDADVNSIYSVATPKIVDNNDINVFTKLDGVYTKVNTLAESSAMLVDGSKQLVDGMKTYNSNFSTYASGIASIRSYTNLFNTKLDDISTGSSKLTAGINQIASSVPTLQQGIEDLSTGSKTLDTGAKALNTSISAITTGVKENASKMVTALTSITLDQATTTQFMTELITIEKTFGVDQTLKAQYGITLDTSNATTYGYKALISTLDALAGGSEKVSKGAAALDDGINNTTTGLTASATKLIGGINQLQAGAKSLNDGINTFKDGFNKYNDSVNTLADATTKLSDGSKKLEDGANTLYDGLNKFNNEGIGALASLINGKLKTTEGKVRELVKLSNDYQSFSDSNINGNTKFITIIEK